MKKVPITRARQNLFNLINDTISKNEPIQISSKTGNVVVVSESEWKGIMETLYLLSVPGMKEKLVDGMNTSLDECVPLEEIKWDSIN